MPRLDRLPELNRKNLLMLPLQVNDTAPFTTLAKPLAACRLGRSGSTATAAWSTR